MKERLVGYQAGAHRGGMLHLWTSGGTLPNFRQAHKEGVDILEMDLRLSKDGVAFVFHDRDMKYKTNCKGSIEVNTRETIEKCRYGWTRDPIPTFREVLAWAAHKSGPRGDLVLNAEFKGDRVVEEALALVKEFDAYGWVYFQVQEGREQYEHVRRIDPAVALLFSPEDETDITWALGLDDPNLLLIDVNEDNGTKRSIPRIHAAGKLVSENSFYRGSELWTARCDRVFADGIDVAISNQTDSCVRQRPASRGSSPIAASGARIRD